MSVVQAYFIIPPEIEELILQGVYTRCGGIVRDANGRIIKHLEEIVFDSGEKADKVSTVAGKAMELIVTHPKEAIIGATGIGAAAGLAVGIAIGKKNRNCEKSKPTDFDKAIAEYFLAIKQHALDLRVIGQLDSALKSLEQYGNIKGVNGMLINRVLEKVNPSVYQYTCELEAINNVELPDDEMYFPNGFATNHIEELRTYLKAQRHIFELAA